MHAQRAAFPVGTDTAGWAQAALPANHTDLRTHSPASHLLQARDALMPLVTRFQELFSSTWPRGDNQDFLQRVSKYASKSKWLQLTKAFRAAMAKVCFCAHLQPGACWPSCLYSWQSQLTQGLLV